MTTSIENKADRIVSELRQQVAQLLEEFPTPASYIKARYGIENSMKVEFETNFLEQKEAKEIIKQALNAEFPK